MRAVIQRVTQAAVCVNGNQIGNIKKGLLIFLGIGAGDTEEDAGYMISKIAKLRAFQDSDGKMNLNVTDVNGQVLLVSQFTLLGDCRKGCRPSFTLAAAPDLAELLYNNVITGLRRHGLAVETGLFRAMMEVSLTNDGPVTFLVDSKKNF